MEGGFSYCLPSAMNPDLHRTAQNQKSGCGDNTSSWQRGTQFPRSPFPGIYSNCTIELADHRILNSG